MSPEIAQPSVTEIGLHTTYLKCLSNFPGDSESIIENEREHVPVFHDFNFLCHLSAENDKKCKHLSLFHEQIQQNNGLEIL